LNPKDAEIKANERMLEEKLIQRERFTERLLRQTLAQDEEIRHLKADAKIRDERLTSLHSENIRLKEQIAAQYQQAGDRYMVGLRRLSKCSVTISKV
jgi:hypothetical protein